MNKNLLPRLPVQKSLKRSEITPDMRRQIEVQKRDWGLEGSGFFDGYFFRDIMGNILPCHPRSEEIIEEHIRDHNEKALEHNNQLKEKEKIRRKFYQSN